MRRILVVTLFFAFLIQPNIVSADPSISIARQGEQVKVEFSGLLESADSFRGEWSVVTNTQSPLLLAPSQAQKFFRARRAAALSIFSSTNLVQLTVVGPLQERFELAHAGMPDGIFPPLREKEYFAGSIIVDGQQIPANLRVRGNSSLQECPFPKLKFKVSPANRIGTPFFDAREVKIGTHCAEGGRGNIGRLREQIATFREALAYETLNLAGFIAPRVRRAEITYRDTTSTNISEMVGWELTRQALLHDDVEVIAERLGGRALDDDEVSGLTNALFNEQLITDLELFHALIGNWDYALSTDGRGLWNTDVIEFADRTLAPVAADFDLASWVTGKVRVMAPHDYFPEWPDVDRQARYAIEEIQRRVSVTSFEAGKARFEQLRPSIEAHISQAVLDAEGRTNALLHTTAFYDALAGVKR